MVWYYIISIFAKHAIICCKYSLELQYLAILTSKNSIRCPLNAEANLNCFPNKYYSGEIEATSTSFVVHSPNLNQWAYVACWHYAGLNYQSWHFSSCIYRLTWSAKVTEILGAGYEFTDAYRTKELTLRDLLSHRTGLARLDIGFRSGCKRFDSRSLICK